MLKLKRITRSEWSRIPREYRGTSQVEVCVHCEQWRIPHNPNFTVTACTNPRGHAWVTRSIQSRLVYDPNHGTCLEFVEVIGDQ